MASILGLFSSRRIFDRLVAGIVFCGSCTVVFSTLAIIYVIISVCLPLFFRAELNEIARTSLPLSANAVLANFRGNKDHIIVLTTDGRISCYNLADFLQSGSGNSQLQKKAGSLQSKNHQPSFANCSSETLQSSLDSDETIIAQDSTTPNSQIFLATSKNRAFLLSVDVSENNDIESETDTNLITKPLIVAAIERVWAAEELGLSPGEQIIQVAADKNDKQTSLSLATSKHRVLTKLLTVNNIDGSLKERSATLELPGSESATITRMKFGALAKTIFITSSDNHLHLLTRENGAKYFLQDSRLTSSARQNSANLIEVGLGKRSVVVEADDAKLQLWQPTNQGEKPPSITGTGKKEQWLFNSGELSLISSNTIAMAASPRNRHLAVMDSGHNLSVFFLTTREDRAHWQTEDSAHRPTVIPDESAPSPILSFNSRGNTILALDSNSDVTTPQLTLWHFHDPHPNATFTALFGPLIYEGYGEPSYTWQSSGGSDDFEAKLSFIPLIFGTFKASFYALLVAIPLAIAAALYCSQFLNAGTRSRIKPTVEFLAAIPSVVIGLIAVLWLGPQLMKLLPALLLSVLCVPMAVYLGAKTTPYLLKKRAQLLIPWQNVLISIWVALGLIVAFQLAHLGTNYFFSGDFNEWLVNSMGITIDQRNAIVVALSLSITIVPVIFTIADDCFSATPLALKSAGYALGASPWKVATTVVFPFALPGVISAVLIGMGRAFGETMILLMASGNTPLMDLSPLVGLRSLSANLAIELPEAAQGDTLYRVLFLSALILLVFTFSLNCLGEYVRHKMKKRAGS